MTRKIDCIVVHCSDSPDARANIGAADIRRWHTDPPPRGRGWADIGYHYVVRRDGVIEPGRPESVIGAHVEGHNARSIGVCWVGRDKPAPVQRAALLGLLRHLMRQHKITAANVFGHRELNPGKTCPNLDLAQLRADLGAKRDDHDDQRNA